MVDGFEVRLSVSRLLNEVVGVVRLSFGNALKVVAMSGLKVMVILERWIQSGPGYVFQIGWKVR